MSNKSQKTLNMDGTVRFSKLHSVSFECALFDRQPPERLPPTRGTNGILERGFEGLYEPLGQPTMSPGPQPS